MIISRRRLVGIALGMLAAGRGLAARAADQVAADQVYESVYNFIFISRHGAILGFRQMESGAPQSEIDLDRPTYQVLPYTRYLFAAALVDATPRRVLGIGLGAGAFNRLFNLAFPEAVLTTVEIDPLILKLAVTLTGLRLTASNQVVIDDGRRFLRHDNHTWDWIVMDPYARHSQIPPHMTTVEFFRLVRQHLVGDGAFVLNIVAADALFYSLFETLRGVFPNNLVFQVPGSGNRIFLATPRPAPPLSALLAQEGAAPSAAIAAALAENGVDFAAIRHSVAAVDVPPGTPVLSDDFAPSEYLGNSWGRSWGKQ